MSAGLAELLALAEAAVDAVAPGLVASDARGDLGIETKSSPTDMVTAMDRWAEETIVGVLLDARPDGPFVCGSVTIFEELVGRLGLAD